MPKDLRFTVLLDIYGALLTEKQRETLELYYNDDLSLGEISEETGITRQGVMNCIKTSEHRLIELESCLGLAERSLVLGKLIEKLEGQIVNITDKNDNIEIFNIIEEIKEKL